jgi:hypothetical protein
MLRTAKTKSTRRRQKPRRSPKRAVARGTDVSRWLPDDDDWKKLPPEVRQAASLVVATAYRRFVLDAPNELERSIGTTLVQLTWLELCGQMQLAQIVANPSSPAAVLESPSQLIERHLRLVKTKCQTVAVLARMKAISRMAGAWSATGGRSPARPLENAQSPPPVDRGELHRCENTAGNPARYTDDFSLSPLPSPLSHTAASLKLENREVDDQLDHPALRLIAARPDVFCRQGNVAATYRRRNGKTFGPYYRLSYREDGRLCSIYLGRAGKLVERVRHALDVQHQPVTQYRLYERLAKQIRASMRIEKIRVRSLLCPFGMRLKGSEVRGWRFSPLRWLLPRRRRWMPRLSVRMPSVRRRSNNDPVSRMHRFLEARDGYVLGRNVDAAVHMLHQRR